MAHAFSAAEVGPIGGKGTGEKTLAGRLYPRLRADELLTTDRGFYSYPAWDTAAATGAALLWRAPTQLALPVVRVLPDGTYLSVVMDSTVRGRRREKILAAARADTTWATSTTPSPITGCRRRGWCMSSSTTCPTGPATAPAS